MTKTFCSSLIATMICGLILSGCDNRPPTPRPKWNKPKVAVVTVDQNDKEEQAAVIAIEVARIRYQNALQALLDHYLTIGDVTKSTWATKELNNLSKAREFAWAGVDIPSPPNVQESDKNTSERFLVENVLVARADYVTAVDKLALLYETSGKDPFKTHIIHTVQHRFLPERTYTYLMSVELPKKYVGQRMIVPEANELFDEAQLLVRGEDDVEWIDYPKQRQAMQKFKRLIQMYPQSPRVADAAYYVGRIYGRYFKEPYLAVRWYEVSLDWDPAIAHPVYYEMATEYDYGLKDWDAAIKNYEESIAKESAYKENYKLARDRLVELRKK
jgi:tetratricopeptide (TPR) repeat protein